jgi:hypothetical protein
MMTRWGKEWMKKATTRLRDAWTRDSTCRFHSCHHENIYVKHTSRSGYGDVIVVGGFCLWAQATTTVVPRPVCSRLVLWSQSELSPRFTWDSGGGVGARVKHVNSPPDSTAREHETLFWARNNAPLISVQNKKWLRASPREVVYGEVNWIIGPEVIFCHPIEVIYHKNLSNRFGATNILPQLLGPYPHFSHHLQPFIS